MKAPEVVLKQAEISPDEMEEILYSIYEILFEETLKVFDLPGPNEAKPTVAGE